jgi:hypothetical protein
LKRAFDIHTLGSDVLTRLYHEVRSLTSGIRIEVVPSRRTDKTEETHPAVTAGLQLGTPTIQFSVSLDRSNRIEAIAHELVHLLLVYRYGLVVIGRKIPRRGSSEDVFHYFMSMPGDWRFLLGQIINTAHHLILIGYLRNEYGIENHLHCRLLQHNFDNITNHNDRDKESISAKGLIAFECEKLVGKVDRFINISSQTDFSWNAYQAAQKFFGGYSSESVPSPAAYKEDILSLLEDLGYQRKDFIFFP